MCMYPDEIKSKRVTIGDPPADTEVPGDTQCRPHSRTREGAQAQRILLRHHCIEPNDDSRYSNISRIPCVSCIEVCAPT